MPELIFDAPAGTRLHRYGAGIEVTTPDNTWLWWSRDERRWLAPGEELGGWQSNHAPCRTLRAFRRHLRKHADSLKGCRVTFLSRYQDHNVSVQF